MGLFLFYFILFVLGEFSLLCEKKILYPNLTPMCSLFPSAFTLGVNDFSVESPNTMLVI
jgi:hypothetical protein